MSGDRTEERLRDALAAVRRQSVEGPDRDWSVDTDADADADADDGVSDLDDEGGGARRRWWMPAVAAVVLLALGVVALVARPEGPESNVTASRPDDSAAHTRAVAQVAEGCRRFRAASPPEAAPVESPAELSAWFDRYDAAIEQARADLRDVPAGSDDDRDVLAATESTLDRQRRALAGARSAAASGDTVEAVRLIDQARAYESIAAFELAQWGAVECDARGVTRPTR